MFPQSPRCKRAGGPTAQRIIQTNGAGVAVYRFSCVADTDKNYRREAKNTNLEQPRSPLSPSIPLFLTSSCVSVSTCVCGAFTSRCIHLWLHSVRQNSVKAFCHPVSSLKKKTNTINQTSKQHCIFSTLTMHLQTNSH